MFALLSVIFGALFTLAFAPYNYHYLGLLALVGLCTLWLHPDCERPARYGFLFGIGNFSTGIYWVYISLHYYGGGNWFFAILANAALIIYLSLYPMIVGYLLHLFRSRPATLYRALLIPFCWMLLEYVRAYVLTGFPWLSVGYSQIDGLFQGLAPLVGVWGLGLVLMLVASFAGFIIVARKWKTLPLLLMALIAVYGTQFIQYVHKVDKPFSVALVQGNTRPITVYDPAVLSANISKYITATMGREESVIIWPEVAIPYPDDQVKNNYLKQLSALMLQRSKTLVTGIFIVDQKDHFYNSVITLGNGQGSYSKDHLLPFGEYIPLRSVLGFFGDFVQIPMSDMSRGGKNQSPIVTNGVKAGVSICFEGAFGRVVRQSLPDAQYLINVSNDSWFKDSNAADQHLQMDQMRALELGREMARATSSGYTAFIDHKGKIRSQLPRDIVEGEVENPAAVLSGKIQPYQGLTPYAKFGNKLFIIMMALYAIMLCLIYLMRKKKCKNNTKRML